MSKTKWIMTSGLSGGYLPNNVECYDTLGDAIESAKFLYDDYVGKGMVTDLRKHHQAYVGNDVITITKTNCDICGNDPDFCAQYGLGG